MKSTRTMFQFLGATVTCLAIALTTEARDEKLVERVSKGEPSAISEAGKTGDKTFIPLLEKIARPHSDPQVDAEQAKGMDPERVKALKDAMWRPVYTEPVAVNARMALAKLGVKEYLNELVLEATSPTNSPVYKERLKYREFSTGPHEALMTQYYALKKLVYVHDPSTVKYIASVLYDPYDPNKGNTSDVIQPMPAYEAAETLRQIVKDGPNTDDVGAWQKWWEQNKDKYP